MKTNAMRILDTAKIPYEVRSYPIDDGHLDALSVAKQLDLDPFQICKTIVTRTKCNQIYVFCIPGPFTINLKKGRSVVDSSNLELVNQADLRQLTGYIRGGVSPLGMTHTYPLIIEETIQLFSIISISAGRRGLQLILSPHDLFSLTHATYADII